MGKTRIGKRYVAKDEYFHKAKKEGFVARSVFKLQEIDAKHKLYKPGMKILDLGCAPGSWLQYAAKKAGPNAYLLGIDLDPVRVDIKTVHTIQGDLLALAMDNEHIRANAPFDFIQSDAMTKTTGIPDSDCARSVALVEHGLQLARQGALKEGGAFLAKVFEGPGFTDFYVNFKKLFSKCSVNKPESIRQGSREVYVLGLGFRGLIK
ncbi:MAG: RlmE family RNA methyltransferase [Bdellovibrionales bacterium]|nr:RlmE family RNA methyltransferase [Bdellovibrionales bacterium]